MKKILVWALTIMLSVVSCMFSVFATDSDEGAIEKDGIDREMEDYKLYSEEKFWEIMYTTYDESAIMQDSDSGGVRPHHRNQQGRGCSNLRRS